MNLAASQPAPSPRVLKRAAALRAQRRSGNGSVADLAAFCDVSERTVVNWKDQGLIGYTQIGNNIWFSEDDVAEIPAQYHHRGKFCKTNPGDQPALIRKRWREFLGAVDVDADLRAEIEAQRIFILRVEALLAEHFPGVYETAVATVKASAGGGQADSVRVVHHAAVSVFEKEHAA